mmetsp:Transcript_6597/g.14241  ORF Transcript_6597/g.14241 Transcript_6597/m.14241 type:complete len:436 (-) Transcript_6597:702-2009(-)
MVAIKNRKRCLFLSATLLLLFLLAITRLGGGGTGSARTAAADNAIEGPSSDRSLHLRLLRDQTQARCLDGSPSGYWFRNGSGDDGGNFLLVFVGAGWCRNAAECLARAGGAVGSSTSWSPHVTGYGLTSADPSENPDFHSFSVAWVGYCDGAFFMGDRQEPLENGLHFQGRAIVRAVVSDLVRRNHLSGARSVIVTGESSGGLAAALSVDSIRALLPEVEDVRAVVDAGYFLDLENSGGDRQSLEEIRVLSNMTLNDNCLAHYAQKEGWRCASMPYAHRFIRSSLLIVQSAFDYAQLGAYGADLNCTPPGTTFTSPMKECDAAHMHQFQSFGAKMVQELSSISTANGRRSVFVIGCITHGLTQYGLYQVDKNKNNSDVGYRIPLFHNLNVEVPAASGRTVSRAVRDWYFDRNSDSYLDSGPWPSNEGCAWMGMPY